MRAFDYFAPATLSDAIARLSQSAGQARPLAGGTDLIDQMRVGRHTPELLIDIKKIPELNVLQLDEHGLRIGAAVPCWRITEHPELMNNYAALVESCRIIGSVQIQSRASIGGNLCNSSPAADTTPSLIAHRATCVIAGPKGKREVAAESFCTAPGQNVLQPGELLVELRFPPPPPLSGSHYRRMIPRNEMDIAVVGVGAQVVLDQERRTFVTVRLALGAVAPTPLLASTVGEWLAGRPATRETIDQAASSAQRLVAPITDMRGTREYRIHATGVLVGRVLHTAVARAQGAIVDYHPGQ